MLNCCDHIGTNTSIRKEACCIKLPHKNVTHVIFNLEGTLVDTKNVLRSVLKEICRRYKKQFPQRLYEMTDGILVEDMARLLMTELKLPVMKEDFITTFNDLFKDKSSGLSLMPGAQRLIRHLHQHNIPSAAVTFYGFEPMQLMLRTNSRVFNLLRHIVCGGSEIEAENGNPAVDIYRLCASRFKNEPPPGECLVFESSASGLEGALEAGMQVVLVPEETMSYDVWRYATMRVDSLEEVPIELFGLPPLNTMKSPVPNVSFTMKWREERKPPKIWQKIKAEVKYDIKKKLEEKDAEGYEGQ